VGLIEITSLNIYLITEPLFRIIISQCLAVENGFLGIHSKYSDQRLPILDITLTRLTTIQVHFHNAPDLSILDGIHFPVLDNLTFYMPYPTSDSLLLVPEQTFNICHLAPITTLSLVGGGTYRSSSVTRRTWQLSRWSFSQSSHAR